MGKNTVAELTILHALSTRSNIFIMYTIKIVTPVYSEKLTRCTLKRFLKGSKRFCVSHKVIKGSAKFKNDFKMLVKHPLCSSTL